MKLANAVEKLVELARESERQKIQIAQLSEEIFDLRKENEQLKQILDKQNIPFN